MRIAIGILFALALAVPAGAEHCTTWSTTTNFTYAAAAHYLSLDIPQQGPLSIRIYAESNELSGLQRGDEMVDDTCHGSIQADELIF